MGFYQELSKYYDEIFPVNAAELSFVRTLIDGKDRLLDMGCGTGNKTVLLAEGKKETLGFDLDSGMIERANQENRRANIHYLVQGMLDIDREFGKNSFDAALCLGNTLAHLLGADELGAVFRKTAHILAANGCFVIQILNYDRILDNNITALPVIETDNVVFTRTYETRDGALRFLTELKMKKGGDILRNDIPLRPIRKREIEAAYADAGFGEVEYFGSYAGAPYGPDSFHLIAKGSLAPE